MQCQEIQKKLSAYLDGELTSGLSQQIVDHMDFCDDCRARLKEMQDMDSLLKTMPRIEMSPGFAEKMAVRVRTGILSTGNSGTGKLGLFNKLRILAYNFMDLLEKPESPHTHALDEFCTFPPLSLGYTYCILLEQCKGE